MICATYLFSGTRTNLGKWQVACDYYYGDYGDSPNPLRVRRLKDMGEIPRISPMTTSPGKCMPKRKQRPEHANPQVFDGI